MGALFYRETPARSRSSPSSVSPLYLYPIARVACCDLKWVPRIHETDSETSDSQKRACSAMTDCRVKFFHNFAERVVQRDNIHDIFHNRLCMTQITF